MQKLNPPINLDGLPQTRAVWVAHMSFQSALQDFSILMRDAFGTARYDHRLWPSDPDVGSAKIEHKYNSLSMHQRLEHHQTFEAFKTARQTILNALQTHPAHVKGTHNLFLRANAKSKVFSGSHHLPAGDIAWKSSNSAKALTPFLERLEQHERLSWITPDKDTKTYYAFIDRNGPSTSYAYAYGADAADAALRTLIGTTKPLYVGAQFHRSTKDRLNLPKEDRFPAGLPERGTCPVGEVDWLETLKKRASAAGIPLYERPNR